MTQEDVRNLKASDFKRLCGVTKETFAAMCQVIIEYKQLNRRGRPPPEAKKTNRKNAAAVRVCLLPSAVDNVQKSFAKDAKVSQLRQVSSPTGWQKLNDFCLR